MKNQLKKSNETNIKALLPRGWLAMLVEDSGFGKDTVSKVVNQKLIKHPVWPFVLALAEKHQASIRKNKLRTEALVGENVISEGEKAALAQKLA